MPSPFHGINMAGSALRLFQRALDTTGHNIANVNTPGFSRQRVDLATNHPTPFFSRGFHALGSGITMSTITRIRDVYLDERTRVNNGDLGRSQALANGLRQIEGIYNEPSEFSISTALDRFFNSWSGLGSDPGNIGLRAEVRNAGQSLADRIRTTYQDMLRGHQETDRTIRATFNRINELANVIHEANAAVRAATATAGSANDLMDQRDRAVEELSNLVNVHVERFEDGSYAVYAAGHTLVDPFGPRPFPTDYNASAGTVTDGNLIYQVRTGSLAGLFQLQQHAQQQMSQLDQLANTLRTQINALHSTGQNAAGDTGLLFFNDATPPDPQTGAIDFDLSLTLKSSIDNLVTGVTGRPGDGGIALSISEMREAAQADLGNRSFQEFHRSNLNRLASDVSFHRHLADTEAAIAEQLDSQRQAVMGVSLDEEMTNLMKYQRSYQAMARALTVFDQTTEDLIGMLRR